MNKAIILSLTLAGAFGIYSPPGLAQNGFTAGSGNAGYDTQPTWQGYVDSNKEQAFSAPTGQTQQTSPNQGMVGQRTGVMPQAPWSVTPTDFQNHGVDGPGHHLGGQESLFPFPLIPTPYALRHGYTPWTLPAVGTGEPSISITDGYNDQETHTQENPNHDGAAYKWMWYTGMPGIQPPFMPAVSAPIMNEILGGSGSFGLLSSFASASSGMPSGSTPSDSGGWVEGPTTVTPTGSPVPGSATTSSSGWVQGPTTVTATGSQGWMQGPTTVTPTGSIDSDSGF